MIDIESKIVDAIRTDLISEYPLIYVASEYVPVAPAFPAVIVYEVDNYSHENSMEDTETHANVLYEVQVYSNKSKGRKAEAKTILARIDAVLQGYKFVRTMKLELRNPDQPSVFRLVARYRAVVSTDYRVYRR